MSIKSDRANLLTINCVQELPENELAIVSATNECISVEDRVVEKKKKGCKIVNNILFLEYIHHRSKG